MAWKAGLLALFLMAGAASLRAEVNLGLSLGIRDQDDYEHSFGVFGLTADFGPNSWIVRPEVGLFNSLILFDGGSRIEESLGVIHSWRRPRYRINLGGGLTSIPAQARGIDSSTLGGYVHGGIEYVREEGSTFGLDLRYGKAEDSEVPGGSLDYVQLSFVINWHIRGPRT
jgi:hypothetical protein